MFKNEKKQNFDLFFFKPCFFREKNRFFPKKTSLFFSGCNPSPKISELFHKGEFDCVVCSMEKQAWEAFRFVATGFLGNNKTENYMELVGNLFNVYKSNMSLKILFLDSFGFLSIEMQNST